MGAWGTGISSNDTYADIFEEFIELYNEGFSVSEITKKLVEKNEETINLPEDSNNFWFAIANAQWECKSLHTEVLSKIERIIQTGEDLKVWKELEASDADIKAREKVLAKFLIKLRIEKDKPRKRTKKKLYNSIFKKGDCLIYKMDNGNHGCAFVLADEQETKVGTNYIAITTIDKADRPTLQDFKDADVYMKRVNQIRFKGSEMIQEWIEQPQIGGFSAISFKKEEIEIEVIGQLPIYKGYEIKLNRYIGFGWTALKIAIPSKDAYIKINGSPKLKLKLNEWTKKKWYRL